MPAMLRMVLRKVRRMDFVLHLMNGSALARRRRLRSKLHELVVIMVPVGSDHVLRGILGGNFLSINC